MCQIPRRKTLAPAQPNQAFCEPVHMFEAQSELVRALALLQLGLHSLYRLVQGEVNVVYSLLTSSAHDLVRHLKLYTISDPVKLQITTRCQAFSQPRLYATRRTTVLALQQAAQT